MKSFYPAQTPALIVSLAAAWLITVGSAAAEPNVARGVETLEPIGAHSVWVPDRLFGHSRLYDGDTGNVLAIVDAAGTLTPMPPLYAPSRKELYAVEVDYSRGRRGDRIDYVSIYDAKP